ncbi:MULTISPECIES: TonB-dependent siderophore receptor [unclassified Rhizobium]|uniref:TonB-dependent siderophore receptor n=1 Tax=unclassified Rhizobium TaxID=2613769 RepID=UPI0006F99A78|nr:MULTISPECIES: TonB-dependent siderophore receptor [unclassified Rhizobium]KQV44615.1 ferrichrome-iron receptor [Rhizobium sp. Root1212]KRD38798.1 ferrichrome-iron receptor [Rhizobium sp. Root268]
MRMKGTRRFLMAGVSLAAVMVAPVAARAQDVAPGGETQLERLVVEGGKVTETEATGPVEGYVAKVTDTGSKAAMAVSDIPQSVSVIGREELNDRGVVNKVDEALRYTAGVAAEPFGSDPDTDWFYIRGFDATQTGVFLDGLNLFSYGFGGFQSDPFMLERVEVLKGPASVLYGGSSPGGIVDLVRKRPQDDPLYYAEIGINNFGNAFFGFDVNDKLKDDGTITYRITGKIAGGDNYTDYSEDLRGFLLPQITYAPDDATSLTVYALASDLDQTHIANGFLPYFGTVEDGPLGGKIDRDFFYGEPDHDYGRYDQQMIGYEFEHQFDSGWTFSQNLRFAHLDKSEELVYPYAYAATGDLARLGFKHDTSVDSFNVDNRLQNEFESAGTEHNLLVGLDYKNFKIDQTQASAFPASDLDPTDPDYGGPIPAYSVYLDGVSHMQQVGVYAQDQIRFGGGWLVTLNGRYDYVDTETDSRLANGSFSTNDSALSGRAGLAYELDNGLTPYVSASSFFNPLIGISASGTPLVPEEGVQYEAGIKYEPTIFDGLLTASLFHLTKENALNPNGFTMTQLGEVESKGIELEGKVNVDQNWKLLASYTYTDMEITEEGFADFVGKRPRLIPEHQVALWVDYTITDGAMEGVSLGGGLRYQGKSAADNLNTEWVPSAVVADAAIRYEKNGWGAAFNVSNLFDKEYVKGCQELFTCGYGEQRTVTLKLSKTF